MSKAKRLFDSYRGRSTARLQAESDMGILDSEIAKRDPGIRSTKEAKEFEVGQTVRCTESGGIKQGVEFVIEDHHVNGPYHRYYGAGMWHRTQDLEAVE